MAVEKLQRILYVEDEEDIRAIAQVALDDIGGFEVKYCGSWKEVEKTIETFHPQLFLLDVMMPGMDGPSMLKELRKREECKDIPAIFMTAKIQEDEIAEYKELGAIDVISKPFDPMTLADTLKKLWEKYHG